MSFPNLKNFWQSIIKDKLLLLALFAGLLLRAGNPTFGSPSLFISNDEAIAHLSALNMLAEKTPVSIANYTPLGAYLQIPFLIASFAAMRIFGLVSSISDFELFLLTHEGYFLFIPRLISAFFGTLTILVIYKIGLKLFDNRQSAIISAFLTAVSFNLVHISHFGRPWAAALFFFSLSIFYILQYKSTAAYFTLAFSFGFHQAGLLGAPIIFWLTKKRFGLENLIRIAIFMLIIAFLSLLTLRTGFINSIERNQSFLKVGKLAADILIGSPNLFDSAIKSIKENLLIFFTTNFLVTDGIIFLFAVFGILICLKQGFQKALIFYILGYFIFASLFFHPLPRYLLPIFLVSIPFAAYGLNSILRKRKIFLILIIIASGFNSFWWNYLYFKTPTFIQAHNWINENVPNNIPIAYLGGRYQTFTPNREAVKIVGELNPQYHERLGSILPDDYTDNVRNIVYTYNFSGKDKLEKYLNSRKVYRAEYVVDYYFDSSDRIYQKEPALFDVIVQFNPVRNGEKAGIPEPLFDATWNFSYNDSRPKVSMYSLSNAGPYVDILKVKN